MATKKQLSPVTRSSVCSTRSRSCPAASAFARSSSSRGQSFACIAPPMHLSAQAAVMPSGVPPMPISTSTSDSPRAAAMAPAMSPSEMNRMPAPTRRISRTSPSCRGRSRTQTVTSATSVSLTSAIRRRLSATPALMSIASAYAGPTAIFSM